MSSSFDLSCWRNRGRESVRAEKQALDRRISRNKATALAKLAEKKRRQEEERRISRDKTTALDKPAKKEQLHEYRVPQNEDAALQRFSPTAGCSESKQVPDVLVDGWDEQDFETAYAEALAAFEEERCYESKHVPDAHVDDWDIQDFETAYAEDLAAYEEEQAALEAAVELDCTSLPSSSRPLMINAPEKPKCQKSVHWHEDVVSEVHSIDRLAKEEICGEAGVDNWMFFAEARIAAEHDQWAQRTLTIDDLDCI